MSQTAEERRALVDKLAAAIQTRVLSGELPSGARLRQEALAEEFGVSRTPIREALRKLQASGFVEVLPRRGALVRHLTPSEIRDGYEVRATLEGLAAELAAERISREQLGRLRAAQQAFRDSLERTLRLRERPAREGLGDEEIERWGRANDEFHQAIHEASANEVLEATLRHLHRSFPRDLSRTVVGESTTRLRQNVGEHEAILDAIERRDGAAARELMLQHVRRSGALVTLRFEQRGAAG